MKVVTQPDKLHLNHAEVMEIVTAAVEAKTGRKIHQLCGFGERTISPLYGGETIEIDLTFELCPSETP